MSLSPNRVVGAVLGVGFLVIGVAGFFVTAGVGFATARGALLLGVLSLNPLQNVAHLVLGSALLVGVVTSTFTSVRVSGVVNSWVGAVCLVLGLFGLFTAGTTINPLALNGADNVLHFGGAALLMAVGLGADLPPRRAS